MAPLAHYFFWAPVFLFGLISILTYAIPQLYLALFCRKERNLKKDYGAEWALVTGELSSPVGRPLLFPKRVNLKN